MKKTSKITLGILSLAICSSWSLLPGSTPIGQTLADGVRTASSYQVSDSTFKYNFLSNEDMPILGYLAMPPANGAGSENPSVNPSYITKSHFMTYKNAGFNIVSGLYERDPFSTPEIHKALEVAKETGLVYFVNDVSYRCDSRAGAVKAKTVDEYRSTMQDKYYLNESAFGGIAVKDEPSYQDFKAMGNVNEALKSLTDGKIVYSTLFPSYVGSSRLYLDDTSGSRWDMYARYVSEYVNIVKPDILAYDYYAFMKEDATLENTYGSINPVDLIAGQINLAGYLESLSYFRKISQENDIPYWVTVASYNHRHKSNFTKKQISWTVNTSLAYGAKGIQYYTYWPTMNGSNPSNWADQDKKSGLVTETGTPHDTYYMIKEINENIKTVDHVLMKSTHKGVIQFGKGVLQMVDDETTLHSYGLLNSVTGGDTFVGCFEKDGKDVFYIVNNSINAGRQKLKANFLNKVNVRLTNIYGTQTMEDAYSVGFNLSGGEAILLEVL